MKKERTSKTAPQRNFFWEQAPESLLEKVVELNGVLAKFRNTDQNAESLAFYESVLKIMRLAYMFMANTRHVHQRNAILEANIRFLSTYNQKIELKLQEIETVTRLRCEDRFEEVLEASDAYMQTVLSCREKINLNGGKIEPQTP